MKAREKIWKMIKTKILGAKVGTAFFCRKPLFFFGKV